MSVDDYVAAIFGALEAAAGVLDNTYVIATSDHGCEQGARGGEGGSVNGPPSSAPPADHLGEFRIPFEKSLPYETDVRPPFYIRGPGIAPGSSIAGPVSLMDVGATLLELAGATQPGEPQ